MGAVYKWVDESGQVQYSDQPPEEVESEEVRILEGPSQEETRRAQERLDETRKALDEGSERRQAAAYYRRVAILKPGSEEVVRDNQGIVSVELEVDPPLDTDKGHQIQMLLDGRPAGPPSDSLEQSVQGVIRGSHRLAAQILDETGQVLITSPSVGFQMMIASPLFHPPRPDTPPEGVQQAPRAPMAPRAPRAPHAPFRPAPAPPAPPPPPGAPVNPPQ